MRPKVRPTRPTLLYPVTGIVIADRILLGMVVLSNNGQFFYVKSGFLQFLDNLFGLCVVVTNCDSCIFFDIV